MDWGGSCCWAFPVNRWGRDKGEMLLNRRELRLSTGLARSYPRPYPDGCAVMAAREAKPDETDRQSPNHRKAGSASRHSAAVALMRPFFHRGELLPRTLEELHFLLPHAVVADGRRCRPGCVPLSQLNSLPAECGAGNRGAFPGFSTAHYIFFFTSLAAS